LIPSLPPVGRASLPAGEKESPLSRVLLSRWERRTASAAGEGKGFVLIR
jgi:hypothetical protein